MELDDEVFADFDLLLPSQVLDESGAFLEDTTVLDTDIIGGPSQEKIQIEEKATDVEVKPEANAGGRQGNANASANANASTNSTAGANANTGGGAGTGKRGSSGGTTDAKKAKRRRQIAAASRASRARRKRELEDLREENKRLREERSQFLSKIGELQMKVENMRERGSLDMRVENELLRAQLMEHKRFVSCFKHLCDGAPTTLNARHIIYKQGSDSAQAHVLGLISQSQADNWLPAIIPPEADIPYQNFSMFYKFKADYGSSTSGDGTGSGSGSNFNYGDAMNSNSKVRQRLNIRIDMVYPGMDASHVSDFLWDSFSKTSVHQRLYDAKGIELTQLADDMPDKDTKMVYYREKWEAPKKDQDWVMICNRRRRDLPKSTLAVPSSDKKGKPTSGKVGAVVLALSTTQHSVAPQFQNANRITSMFVQGAVVWNIGGDSKLCLVFSLPEDFEIKAVKGFKEVLHSDGTLTLKFAETLKEFNKMLGEHGEAVA